MPLNETVQISRSQFIAVAASFVKTESDALIQRMNAAKPLVDQLNGLAEEARAAGLQLDDASAAANPAVADLRQRMDPLMSQIAEIQRDIQEIKRISETAQGLFADGTDGAPVSLCLSDALRLLHIDIPELN